MLACWSVAGSSRSPADASGAAWLKSAVTPFPRIDSRLAIEDHLRNVSVLRRGVAPPVELKNGLAADGRVRQPNAEADRRVHDEPVVGGAHLLQRLPIVQGPAVVLGR